jgi:hypothetical protein
MQAKEQKTEGVSLYLTLAPADADILRAAVPASLPHRDGLGIKTTDTLAQLALGAIARALLGQGYQAQPVSAEIRHDGEMAGLPLPPGVIRVQFGEKGLS